MATTRAKKGASKVHHLGRHKARILHYYECTYPLRKLKRLLKHSTESEARAWAKNHGVLPLFERLVA